jgi:hypothetical protein
LPDDVAIPPEPYAANRPQRISEGDREPTRLNLIIQVHDTVGDDDETAQTNASQGFDSLVTPFMMPTIEKVWGKLPEAAPVTGAVCIASR